MDTATQLLSKHVYQKVTSVKPESGELRTDYIGIAHRFPMLIRRNGLIQALRYAQYQADENGGKSSGIGLFLKHFFAAGPQGEPVLTLASFLAPEADMVRSVEALSLEPEYLRVIEIVLNQAEWFKRFAQSVLDIEKKSVAPVPSLSTPLP